MDYDISLDFLKQNLEEINNLKVSIDNIVSQYNSCSINSCSLVSGLANSLSSSFDRLDSGYLACSTWLDNYSSDLNTLEDNLAQFNVAGVNTPSDFNHKFIDLFGKKTIPTLTGDKNLNLELGEIGTSKSIQSAMDWAVAIAADNTHGYSQASRWGSPDYDCSSFVISAYEKAGIPVRTQYGANSTSDMVAAFKRAGFEYIPGNPTAATLQPGDVLWRQGHTEMYIGDNKRVGAHYSIDGAPGGNGSGGAGEISVQSGVGNWAGVLRYVGN